jgi:hypothetical protein
VTGTRDVDWTAVERRGRRLNWLALAAIPVFFGALVVLMGRFAFWEGSSAWLAVGAFVLYALVLQVLSAAVPRLRARTGQAFRIQYALRHRVDPGAELRAKTDSYARRMAANGWLAWLFPCTPIGFLLGARWDRPLLAVPAASVVVAAAVAVLLWWRRQAAAARRWVADAPGPDRNFPPLKAWERWTSGRRLLWMMLGFVLLAVLVSTVAIVLLD